MTKLTRRPQNGWHREPRYEIRHRLMGPIAIAAKDYTGPADHPWSWTLADGLRFGDPAMPVSGHTRTLSDAQETIQARFDDSGIREAK